MKAESGYWTPQGGFKSKDQVQLGNVADLVFYFGDASILREKPVYDSFKETYPKAQILGCSTGGEILNTEVNDESCVYIAMKFESSKVKTASSEIKAPEDSFKVGENLGKELAADDLRAIFVLSEGLKINGSALVKGINSTVDPKKVIVSGGLAGDGDRFETTFVGCNGKPRKHFIAAVGLYGSKLNVQAGSEGGWEPFGPQRLITQSQGNILYEFDGKPALDLYKKYLGDEADNLPSSALYYPIAIWPANDVYENSVIRTVLSVDEKEKSMVFAGDVPEGYRLCLMWGKFDNIVDGAAQSAGKASDPCQNGTGDSVSMMISCLGRKALMGQRIVDEIEQASKVLGSKNIRAGFYSYGEIAKHKMSGISVLHNQTMTITSLSESA